VTQIARRIRLKLVHIAKLLPPQSTSATRQICNIQNATSVRMVLIQDVCLIAKPVTDALLHKTDTHATIKLSNAKRIKPKVWLKRHAEQIVKILHQLNS